LVKVLHVLGDRRDHFTTMNDIWEIFRVILAERKRREIDPTLEFLEESVAEMRIQDVDQAYVEERVEDMLNFFNTVTDIYDQFERIPTERLRELFRMSNKLTSLLEQVSRE
jgi:DNA-binding transcriptional regulator GbsR (MarR family)